MGILPVSPFFMELFMYKIIKDPLGESVEFGSSHYMLTLDGLKKWYKRNLNIDLAFVFTSDKKSAIKSIFTENRGDNALPYRDRFALAVVSSIARATDGVPNNFATRRFGINDHCTSETDNIRVWTSHIFAVKVSFDITIYVRDILDYIDLQAKLYILVCHKAALFFEVVPPLPAAPFNVYNSEPIDSIGLNVKDATGGAQLDFFELNIPMVLDSHLGVTRSRAKFNNEGEVLNNIKLVGKSNESDT